MYFFLFHLSGNHISCVYFHSISEISIGDSEDCPTHPSNKVPQGHTACLTGLCTPTVYNALLTWYNQGKIPQGHVAYLTGLCSPTVYNALLTWYN